MILIYLRIQLVNKNGTYLLLNVIYMLKKRLNEKKPWKIKTVVINSFSMTHQIFSSYFKPENISIF